jgi:hypothetical protein
MTKTNTVLTPYAVAKLANAELTKAGLTEIKPQMVYNYVKNNLIPSTDGKIAKSDAEAWIAKYVARKAARNA